MRRQQSRQQIPQVNHNPRVLLLAVITVTVLVAIYITFAPGKGLYQQSKLKKEMIVLEEKNKEYRKENIRLAGEINQLEQDDEYIEEIARKKYGLLKENEILFQFNSKKKK